MIQGAIFDMDGVLVDNLDYHLEAFRRFGHEQGKALTNQQIQAVFGRKNADMLQALLARQLSDEEIRRYEARKEQLYRELIRPRLRTRVVTGLFEFIHELEAEGFRLAVATSGPKENVDMVLDDLGLREDFSSVVTGDQVKNGKPHPEAFLLAARRISLPPSECVVFEDSFSGVEAAQKAGCRCVALATTHTENELANLSPDRIIKSFLEIGVAELRELSPD